MLLLALPGISLISYFVPKILHLKKENPGTVLMVEVGYRYKFFGDDAKVNQEGSYKIRCYIKVGCSEGTGHGCVQ